MTSSLNELASTGTGLASLAWRAGSENVDYTEHVAPVPREAGLPDVDLTALRQIIDKAMELFPDDRAASDAWLAPRFHVALRLTRREAARRGLWRYLAMVEFPYYVRWRWGPGSSATNTDKPPTPERFHGEPSKQALARLWWGAEQFRDGPDYAPVELAFTNQDLMNNLARMDIGHHRPTVQAAVKVLFPKNAEPRGGDVANSLSKAANLAATTLLIDALAPDEPLDGPARTAWMIEDIDPLEIIESIPAGPADPSVPKASIATMTEHFTRLVIEAPMRPSRARRKGSLGPEDDSSTGEDEGNATLEAPGQPEAGTDAVVETASSVLPGAAAASNTAQGGA